MKRTLLLLFVGLIAACSKPADVTTMIDGFALGTTYHIVVRSDKTEDFQADIDALFQEINMSMSIYCDSSLISRLNRNETDSLDQHLIYCLETAFTASRQSDGMYDVTVKPLSDAYGFAKKERISKPNIDSLLEFVGYEKITIENGRLRKSDPRVQLDLNSVAKGCAVDLVGQLIASKGIENYLVEIGGEIVCKGVNPEGKMWSIGVDKPIDGNYTPGANLQVVLGLADQGLATSGNYRRFYIDEQGRKIAHTLNPKTGESCITNLLSATVVAPTCALADAYGTMFMALGLDDAKKFMDEHKDVAALLIYSDDSGELKTYYSPQLENRIRK